MNTAPYTSIEDYLSQYRPHDPVYCIRQAPIQTAAKWFLQNFNGKTLYAVKANPHPFVLRSLIDAGIQYFDVASLNEIELIHRMHPSAAMYFMHPVKSAFAIRQAYFKYNVKDYALDSLDELDKILESTDHAKDLNLYVRISIPNSYAEFDLSSKFGISVEKSVDLIKAVRQKAYKLGICFHVGSQSMHPDAYKCALMIVANTLQESGLSADIIDIGGGFPSIYPGLSAPPLKDFIQEIDESIQTLGLGQAELLCEPGRALVAESGSVLVKVELRKDHYLYINDGSYGALFDACRPRFVFPTRLFRGSTEVTGTTAPFGLYGPTCDSLDMMEGPFFLPSDVAIGDYIEIGQLGAYAITMRTNFNGFYSNQFVLLEDNPLLSMYGLTASTDELTIAI
jgi:ornithine decarboxylase